MYGDADWCGTGDCGGCGTLVADLAREALDEEDSLRPSEVGDAQAFDSLLGTCDAVANGIVQAIEILKSGPNYVQRPIVVRLDGNNAQEGLRILREAKPENVEIVDTMDNAAARAAQLAAGIK